FLVVAVTEQTFFGAKRIPWTEIHSIQTRNISEKGQRDYDGSDITHFQKGSQAGSH
ncbi:MAG: hypothetical protein IT580_18490, partial [Verrucomicrobiales bacterium]|nr:hypothetical protein [Verrucomicrobiales bacterium]